VLEGFSEKATRAVRAAEELAQKLGDQSVATGHLIYGLSLDESRPFHHILRDLNVDPDMFSGYVESLPREPEAGFDPPYNRHVRTVLERSRECADEMKSKTVEPEHMVIALLSIKAGSAYETLKEFSIEPEYVQMLVLEALGYEAEDAPDWF
jgi:ATP-dependent Clp protease ATP-binding subunit ClpA